MTDILLAELGVEPLPAPLGDLGKAVDTRFWSGARLLLLAVLAERFADILGAGWTERALVARESAKVLELSPKRPPFISTEVRVDSTAPLSAAFEIKLGLRFCPPLLP